MLFRIVSAHLFILLDVWIKSDRNFVPVVHAAAMGIVVRILWLDIPSRVESLKQLGDDFKLDLDFFNLGCQYYVDRLPGQEPVPHAVWEGDGLLEELPAPLWLPLLLDRFLQKLGSENEILLLVIYESS